MKDSPDKKIDSYVHSMDWQDQSQLKGINLTRYRKYQYDLISSHIGESILEIGSGDRSFTKLIELNHPNIKKFYSIEPSETLTKLYENKYIFSKVFTFEVKDLFDLIPDKDDLFDTIIMIHVLEHVQFDEKAITHLAKMLKPGGKLLIEVPALPFLFSVHDQALGHYRRYEKKSLKSIINANRFIIRKMWYQDPIGVIGSFLYFKVKKIKLKSEKGVQLVKNQGQFYDKYIIPFESFLEKYITFPFGLSLTAILELK